MLYKALSLTSFLILSSRLGEGTLVSKLDMLTDDPNDDEEDLRNKYSEIKRKMSAPTGLTKTLYNLYLNRK